MTEYSKSGQGASDARSESKQAANEVREGIKDVSRETRDRARSFLDEQKDNAADRVHGFADALRETAREMQNKGGDASSTSRYAERAAEGIDRLADKLENNDVSGVMRDTQRFARRSPALFVGGSVVAGVLLGRFLRSSSDHDHRDRSRSKSQTSEHGYENEFGNGRRGATSPSGLLASRENDPSRFPRDSSPRTSPTDPSSIRRTPGTPPTGGQQ